MFKIVSTILFIEFTVIVTLYLSLLIHTSYIFKSLDAILILNKNINFPAVAVLCFTGRFESCLPRVCARAR